MIEMISKIKSEIDESWERERLLEQTIESLSKLRPKLLIESCVIIKTKNVNIQNSNA